MKKAMVAVLTLVLLLLLVTQTAWAAPSAKMWCNYTVKRGDTMYGIAYRFGTTAAYLSAVNRLHNPRLIYPGQHLQVPCDADDHKVCRAHYKVKPGDTMKEIGHAFCSSPKKIAWASGLSSPKKIHPGQWLCIPRKPHVCW
jgi:LysM repeat protein